MNRKGNKSENSIDFYHEVRSLEIKLILHALGMSAGVQTKAATILNLKPTTLNTKIKQYKIDWRTEWIRTASG